MWTLNSLSGLKVSQTPTTTADFQIPFHYVPSWQLFTTASHKGGLNSLWQVSLEFPTSTPHLQIYQKLQTKLREETLYVKMDLFPDASTPSSR